MVYYNCKLEKTNPKSIKYMLGSGWWNGMLDKDKWFWIMTMSHVFKNRVDSTLICQNKFNKKISWLKDIFLYIANLNVMIK